MVRTLILTVALLFADVPTWAEVATPVHDVQFQIRTDRLLDAIEKGGGVTYAGSHTLCRGGPVSLTLRRVNILPKGWIADSDGRYGLDLGLALLGHLKFDGNQWLCRYDGDVECVSAARIMGPLDVDAPIRGECRSTRLGALAVGFDLVQVPALLATGANVKLPSCETGDAERVCLRWGDKIDGRYVPSEDAERAISFAARLTSAPTYLLRSDAPLPDTAASSTTLIANIHAGRHGNLVRAFPDVAAAAAYVAPGLPADQDFRLDIGLDLLTDIRELSGVVVDEGPLSQALPLLVEGTGHVLIFPVWYRFYLDDVSLYRAQLKDKEVLVLAANAYQAEVRLRTSEHGRGPRLPVFERLRLRVIIDSVEIGSDGAVTLKLRGSDIYVRGVLGFLRLKLGGPLLNDQLAEAIADIPLAEIRTRFDLGLPRCIVTDPKAHHDTKACTGPGLMKQTSGVRGGRAELRATRTSLDLANRIATVSGVMAVTPLSPDIQ